MEPRWMTVRTQMKITFIGMFLICAFPIAFIYIEARPDPAWALLFTGLSLIFVFTFGLWTLSLFRLIWDDTNKKYKMTFEPAITSLETAFVRTNLGVVRKKRMGGKGLPKRTFDAEYEVKSEGLRIGVDDHYDGVVVHLGPLNGYNGKEVQRMKDLIDVALG